MSEEPMLELPEELDLRHLSDQALYTIDHATKVHTGVFYAARKRSIEDTTGVCCHQTACLMGEDPKRYLHTGSHRVVTRGGKRLRLHENTDLIVSANGLDMRCVSIEGDGLYAGDDTTPERALATTWNDPTTAWREQPVELTLPFIAAYKETIRSIYREVKEAGGQIKYLLCHRQSSAQRENDPGRGIYRQIVLPMCVELGLISSPSVGWHVGDGRGIPEQWDPLMKGVKYS